MASLLEEIADVERQMEDSHGEEYVALAERLAALAARLPKSDWRPKDEPDRRGLTQGGPVLWTGEGGGRAPTLQDVADSHAREVERAERLG